MTTEEIIETLEKSRKETAERIKVLQAFVDGKAIEERRISFDYTEWVDNNNPEWRWDKFDYRIKPEYRPFANAEECWNEMKKHKPFGWIKCKEGYFNIVYVNNFYVGLADNDGSRILLASKNSYQDNTFADGTPFGISENF